MPALILPLVEAASSCPRGGVDRPRSRSKTIGSRRAIPTAGRHRRRDHHAQDFSSDAARLLALAAERKPRACARPAINMDGSEGPRAQSTRAFAAILQG